MKRKRREREKKVIDTKIHFNISFFLLLQKQKIGRGEKRHRNINLISIN